MNSCWRKVNNPKKYFITGNPHKFAEAAASLVSLEQLPLQDLPEIQSLDINEIIRHKLFTANDATRYHNAILIVEDTGLYLKALNDFPGPLIKFLLHAVGNEGIYEICRRLDNYDAYATTVFGVLNTDSRRIDYCSATVHGRIGPPTGEHGFGWDPIFTAQGTEKTFAEMTRIEEKNLYSMRSQAMRKLAKALTE